MLKIGYLICCAFVIKISQSAFIDIVVRNFTHVFLDFCCTRNKNVKVNKSFLSKSMALTRESPKNSEKLGVLTFAVKVVQWVCEILFFSSGSSEAHLQFSIPTIFQLNLLSERSLFLSVTFSLRMTKKEATHITKADFQRRNTHFKTNYQQPLFSHSVGKSLKSFIQHCERSELR